MKRLSLLLVLCVVGCKNTSGPCETDDQCSKPARCCGGTCFDLQTSLVHCGTCGNSCGATNGAARCTAGACVLTCSSGFGDCNAIPKDGCETELAVATSNCGTCGKTCSGANAVNVCERSQCLQASCNSGFGDCNNASSDGCEVNLKTTVLHCGSCLKKCEVPNGLPDCKDSKCAVASCTSGFGDCNLDAVDGCETDLAVTDAHCSACGTGCSGGMTCKDSKCVAPELLFYGGLIDFNTGAATALVSAFNVDTRAWKPVPASGTSPGARFGHLAVWDAEGKQMLVWGGYTQSGDADTFIWALDTSGAQPEWKKLTTIGTPPDARGLMGWAWDKGSRTLYLFGGGDAFGTTVFDDLWQLEVPSLKWTRRTETLRPDGRTFVSMAWDSSKRRVVAGYGNDIDGLALDDSWTWDPAADGGGWARLNASTPPMARGGAQFLGSASPLHLFGGLDDSSTLLTDTHRLDDLDGGDGWTALQLAIEPSDRGYMAGASTGDRRFVFGGFEFAGAGATMLSDVWELSADAGWSRIGDGGVVNAHPGGSLASVVARE